MNTILAYFVGFTLAALIHVLVDLLILVVIGWVILAILDAISAPPIARKIVLVLGGLIAILILLGLVAPGIL